MKNVTQNFINDIKTYGRQFDFNVAINNESISNDNINYIKPAFYTSNENNKTALFTTIMQQLKIDTKNELAINSKIEIEAGIKVNESNYQYISYNPYTVSSCEKQEDTNSYVSLAYDKMIESMIDYDLELSEKITVRNYLILICNRLGWSTEHIPSTFINHNKLVDPALHQGINYTFRMALDEIATITCSFLLFKGEDFYLIYPTETNQIIDSSFLDEDNVNIGERYFINSLVFSRAEGSDNIYRKDNESIENNGLHEFKISNNQLLSTNDRDIYIDQMFNYLKTFEFYTFDVQSKGILFLEACDRFTFNLSGNTYSTILLNNEQEFEDGLIEKLYVDRPEETETEYKYADETDKRINQTYLIVDKQNQKIESLVQETSENTQNISRHEQTINGITNTVSSVQTKLNNIQIGGTNILRGTDIVTGLANQGTWANGTWRSATGGNGTRERIDITDSPNGNIKKGWRFTRTAENNSSSVDVAQDSVPVANGQTYTMSCWVRNVSGNTRLRLQYGKNPYRNNQPLVTNTSWKKYTYTFTVGEQSDGSTNGSTNIYFGLFQDSVGVLEICGLKLESGNKATDWSPAPEDIESNLQNNYYTKTETESKIEQKADSITSTVSQNYSTKAETTQAKNEAINSANTSTDNKLANYSTTTQMNSAITQKANEITTTVTTLENKVNNMQVGGRNYLKNSKTTTTLTKPASSYAQYNWDSYHPLATKTLSTPLICTLSFRFIPTDENYRPCTSIVVGKNANGDIWSKRIYYSDLKVKKYSDYYFYYASFTIPATEGAYIQTFIKFILSSSDSANLGGQVSHLKLEDGNMPTDWTPAPEDIENDLDTNYYTKTETESKINQKADEISSTVSSVSTQLNNLQVGGTNLLRGTNIVTTLGSSSAWSSGTWRSAGGGTGTRTSISVSDAPNANIKVGWSTTSTSGQVLIAQDNVKTTSGETYTLSCYAKGTGSILLQYGNGTVGYVTSNIQITDENNWKKYSYTFTSRGTANIYFGSNSAGNNVSFCGMKLEKGNMATDWSPAPEDIESNLTANYYTKTETETKIDQKADNITSTVNKTISNIQNDYTAKTELGTLIEQNWEHIKVAWNQISQYLQLEGTNGSASLNIYNQSNNKLMTLNANGETYYNGSGNEIGKIGIIRQNNKDILAFSMPVDWNNISSSRSMAWGIFDPNNNFLPIFYLAGLYGANNSEYEGQLVVAGGLSAQDIELEQGIIKASISGFQVLNNNDQVMLSVLKNGSGSSTYFNLLDLISTWYNTTVGCHYLDFHNNRLANLGNVPVSETNDPNLIKVINNIGGFDDSYIYASFKNGGDVFVYSNSSDRNLKKNIKETNISAIELIQKINHVQFDWKSNERHQSIGYIAQEMQEVEESFVHHSKYKDKEDWQINTLSVLATATKAIQEQQEIIEDLKSRIEKLEKKVNK